MCSSCFSYLHKSWIPYYEVILYLYFYKALHTFFFIFFQKTIYATQWSWSPRFFQSVQKARLIKHTHNHTHTNTHTQTHTHTHTNTQTHTQPQIHNHTHTHTNTHTHKYTNTCCNPFEPVGTIKKGGFHPFSSSVALPSSTSQPSVFVCIVNITYVIFLLWNTVNFCELFQKKSEYHKTSINNPYII